MNQVNLLAKIYKVKDYGKVLRCSLWHHTARKGDDGVWINTDTWITGVAFGDYLRTNIANFPEGSNVLVEGKLSQNNYEDKDGNKKSNLELIIQSCKNMDTLHKKGDRRSYTPLPVDKSNWVPPADDDIEFEVNSDVPF